MATKKYVVTRCTNCGEYCIWAAWIRTKCTSCKKKIKIKEAWKIFLADTPKEAGHMLKKIKEELAKTEGVKLEKGANYIGVKK